MSKLLSSLGPSADSADAAQTQSAPPGVLRSLMFWICLLLAAGGHGLATLAPSYLRNQHLKAESAVADAELERLVVQVDRYERYCRRLTEVGGSAASHGAGSTSEVPSPRPSPSQRVGLSGWAERGGEGERKGMHDGPAVPLQQIAVDVSLQFHLEDVAGTDVTAAPSPPVSPAIALFDRSHVTRGVMQVFSAVLLLLAFTLCLDSPGERSAAIMPRHRDRRTRHPLAWLGMRYRSAESGGPS